MRMNTEGEIDPWVVCLLPETLPMIRKDIIGNCYIQLKFTFPIRGLQDAKIADRSSG